MESKEKLLESKTDFAALQGNETLFSLIEDKNQLIKSLKKQLENQKLQLKFYMRKHLKDSKMIEFSKTCLPETVEENVHLAIAMGNFRKRSGIKSKIYQLYEQMNELYKISRNTLRTQDCVLKTFFTSLSFLCSNSNGNISIDSTYLISILNDPRQVVLMNNLLDSTIDLQRILEHFKVSCDRLINLEDERNEIIHQTLTLPTNEKFNFKMAVNKKMEDLKLKEERKKERDRQNEISKEFFSVDEQLSELQSQIDTFFSTDETSNIYSMLNNLNEDAKSLLNSTNKISKSKKERFDDTSARNFFKKIGSDQERGHTIRVEYAQKEVKETKSIFHAKFYNTAESDNEIKNHLKEKQYRLNENEFNKDTWTQEIYENVETYSNNKDNAVNDYEELIQQIKAKDELTLNLQNLNKNLNEKINFMQIIIDKQNEQLQQQKTITKFLYKISEKTNNFRNKDSNDNHQNITTYQCQNNKQIEKNFTRKINLECLKPIMVSDSKISQNSSLQNQNNPTSQINNELLKHRKVTSTFGVFSEKCKKSKTFVKAVGLPNESKTFSPKNSQFKKPNIKNGLEDFELFEDVVPSGIIPSICEPIRWTEANNKESNNNNNNVIETRKNIIKREEVEGKIWHDSYCIPFEKI